MSGVPVALREIRHEPARMTTTPPTLPASRQLAHARLFPQIQPQDASKFSSSYENPWIPCYFALVPTTLIDTPFSQAYNSIFNSEPDIRVIGNFPLLPLRTRTRGPAYTLPPLDASIPPSQSPEPDSESYDALDEVLSLFRANTFFRNFEIQGPADRLLIYGILFLSECLGKVRPNMGVR